MAPSHGKVLAEGRRAGGQVYLRHNAIGRRLGGWDRGRIHAMRVLWEEHRKEEDWRFLLIDARNAFNEEKRTAMLWAVRHKCPSGAQLLLTATVTGPRWWSET